MADATYKLHLDTAEIKSKAAEIERTLTEAFSAAGKASSKDSGALKILQEQAKAATEAAKEQRALAEAIKTEEQGVTATAKAAATEREQAARAESQERIALAKAISQAEIEGERQATIAAKADLAERTQAAKAAAQAQIEDQKRQTQAARASTGGANAGGRAVTVGGLQGIGLNIGAIQQAYQAVKRVTDQAVEFAELGTQVRRTEAAFEILSHGAQQAQANLDAIKGAGGGAITTLKAMEIADQSIALHLADTAEGFGALTRAGREVALVSPVIHDVQTALSELGLASANVSFRRLDQLGLSVGEVKAKMKELQNQNGSLDDSQAFLAASIELLDKKYGSILDSSAAAASGTEKLKVAITDLWTALAAGPAGQGVDNIFSGIAYGVDALGNAVKDVTGQATQREIETRKIQATIDSIRAKSALGLGGADPSGQIDFLAKIKQDVIAANKAIDDGVPGSEQYKASLVQLGETGIDSFGKVSAAAKSTLTDLENAAAQAAKTRIFQDEPEQRRIKAQGQTSLREDKVSEDLKPIKALADNLHDIGIDNFFLSIEEGLRKSADTAATATNNVAGLRQELAGIAEDVKNQNGVATPAQQARVEALNAEFAQMEKIQGLYREFKQDQADTAGDNATRTFDQLNRVIAEAKNNVDGFYGGVAGGADAAIAKANELAEAIKSAGSVSPDSAAGASDLIGQLNTEEIDRATDALSRLNSGAFDAVPGIDSLRGSYESMIETLSSGGSLTEEQVAQLNEFGGAADGASGSADALAGVVNALGYEYLSSNTYAAELVQQMWEIEAAQASGAISGASAATQMGVLADEIWAAATAAGTATPELWKMLAALKALNAESAGGGGGPRVYGPPAPGQGGGFLAPGALGDPRKAAQEERDRQIALAREKIAQERAAGAARDQTRRDEAKAQKDAESAAKKAQREAESAAKKAANAAEREFENAAKATENAFVDVAKKIQKALEKVPGLFTPSKVTQEDLDIAKSGGKVNYADDFVRQLEDVVTNNKKGKYPGVSVDSARGALDRAGIDSSGNDKAILAKIKKSWEDQSLFSNKDNLQLINKDAVKDAIDLQTKAADGRQNILDYFGASIDAVKEKFKAGDPQIVGAIADELGQSNDKNIQAMGESLKKGTKGMIEKVAGLLDVSINKATAALDLGDGAVFDTGGASGGGGGGLGAGIAAIPGKIKAIGDKAKAAGQAKIDAVNADLEAKTADLSGAFSITGYDVTTATPPSGAYKITSYDVTGLAAQTTSVSASIKITQTSLDNLFTGIKAPSFTITDVHLAATFGQTLTSDMADAFAAHTADFKSQGSTLRKAIESGFAGNDKDRAQGNGFGDAVFHAVGDGLQAHSDGFTAQGRSIRGLILNGLSATAGGGAAAGGAVVGADPGVAFANEIDAQFTQNPLATSIYSNIGSSLLGTIGLGLSGGINPQIAIDFATGLSTQLDAQDAIMTKAGGNMASSISGGFTGYDFSGAASSAITSLAGGFANETNTTQLVSIGNTLADTIHDGFTGRIQSQDWLGSLISAIVASVMNGLADSLKSSAPGAGTAK